MVRRAPRAFVHGRRFAAVGLAIVLVFGGLTARLYDLQIVRGDYYGALSQQNRILRLPVRAERGSVTDRNGRPLVVNIPGFEVSIIPVDLPRARESELALRLGALLGLPTEAVQGAIPGAAHAGFITMEQAQGSGFRCGLEGDGETGGFVYG